MPICFVLENLSHIDGMRPFKDVGFSMSSNGARSPRQSLFSDLKMRRGSECLFSRLREFWEGAGPAENPDEEQRGLSRAEYKDRKPAQ